MTPGSQIEKILSAIPKHVEIVAAAKGRNVVEISRVLNAGIKNIGENYFQEAVSKYELIGKRAIWHYIGHLQKNKVRKVVRIFDCIQTVDSVDLARAIDEACIGVKKTMPVMIEVNIASEAQKSGVVPGELPKLAAAMVDFKNVTLTGLMTMGAVTDKANLRLQFRMMKELFEETKTLHKRHSPAFRYLSMGMSDSYKIAVEEGANMIRLGRVLFSSIQKEQ